MERHTCLGFLSKDGFFSLKSAYLLAKGLNPLNLDIDPCRWVWDVYTTPRIKFFLWLSSQNSIPTNEVLSSRGFNLCTTCEICGNATEPTIHALKDCPGAKKVWTKLGIIDTNQVFYGLPLLDWLKSNYSSSDFFPLLIFPGKFYSLRCSG